MATPVESPITFSNVGKARWWRSGIFASQTGLQGEVYLMIRSMFAWFRGTSGWNFAALTVIRRNRASDGYDDGFGC